MRKWLRRNWLLVVLLGIVSAFAFVAVHAILLSSDQERECAQRQCPEGMTPAVVQYQGCVCLVRPR